MNRRMPVQIGQCHKQTADRRHGSLSLVIDTQVEYLLRHFIRRADGLRKRQVGDVINIGHDETRIDRSGDTAATFMFVPRSSSAEREPNLPRIQTCWPSRSRRQVQDSSGEGCNIYDSAFTGFHHQRNCIRVSTIGTQVDVNHGAKIIRLDPSRQAHAGGNPHC